MPAYAWVTMGKFHRISLLANVYLLPWRFAERTTDYLADPGVANKHRMDLAGM